MADRRQTIQTATLEHLVRRTRTSSSPRDGQPRASSRPPRAAPTAPAAAQLPADAQWEEEEWYGTKYHRTPFSAEMRARWAVC